MSASNSPNEPENAVMLISYKSLRTIVGILGMFLSIILVVGMIVIGTHPWIQSSISHFYHTRMGDVFVGLLTAIALFLFVYRGPHKADNWLSNITGILGITVAFCPTVYHAAAEVPGCMFNRAPFNPPWTQNIHLGAALLFLVGLTLFCIWLFPKTNPGETVQRGTQKWKRNMVYYVCGVIMALCIVALVVSFLVLSREEIQNSIIVFLLESIALFFFGISWLVKGEQVVLAD